MADVSTVTIEELSGSKRVLELHGAGLPHKPTKWSGKQSVKTTWYPGNARASQQVLGPQESPSTWSGKWSRIKLTRSPAVVNDGSGSQSKVTRPDLLMAFVEEVKGAGSLLRVTWTTQVDGDDVTVAREGRLVTISWDIDTPHDIAWEFNFEWVGKTGTNSKRVTSTRDDSSSQTVALNSALNGLVDTLIGLNASLANRPTTPANVFSLGQLEALASYPMQLVSAFLRKAQSIVTQVQRVGDVITTVGTEPAAINNMFVEFAVNAKNGADNTHDELTGIPAELMSSNTDAVSMLRAAQVFGQATDGMRTLSDTATDLAIQARQHISSNPGGPTPTKAAGSPFSGSIAVYECHAGDTPVLVSMQFYNSPDYVLAILQANHLPWWTVTLPVGKILTIPQVPRVKVSV